MLGASCSPAMHLKELGLPFPVKFFWALGGAAWVSPQPSLFQKEAARLPQPLPLLIAWPLKSSHGAFNMFLVLKDQKPGIVLQMQPSECQAERNNHFTSSTGYTPVDTALYS